jgi:high-affinity Fe2+/Pb2+ permease
MKKLYAIVFLLTTLNAISQDGSARAIGGHLGKFIVGFLIAFLFFRFVVKPALRKK